MLPPEFQQAVPIIKRLTSNGFDTYFVGGAVRDFLLNRKIKDIDIATAASPKDVKALFDKVIPVGIEHGTVIVRYQQTSYEITTFREDGTYSDQRHPDEVTFVKTIDDDLKRRDFTINALAMDQSGKIIDLYGGKEDIQNRLIRTVGNAKERFLEDPLRIIRALRFSSQLGFTIAEHTLKQMKAINTEIKTVSVERLTNEFTKLFQGKYVKKAIDYFVGVDIYRYVPIFKTNTMLITKIPNPLSAFYSFAEVITMFHFIDNTISIKEWVKAWKCSNDVKKEAEILTESLSNYQLNGIDPWLVYSLNRNYFRSFIHLIELLFQDTIELEYLYKQKENLPINSRQDLNINGYDLQEIFPHKKRGPWMKQMIEKIEYQVVMKQLDNKKETIKEWILCHPPETN